MTALTTAFDRSQAFVGMVQAGASRLKAEGNLPVEMGTNVGNLITPSPLANLSNWQDQARNQQRYAQYRGWTYSAIHAISQRAASQPVCIGRFVNNSKEKSYPSGVKSYYLNKIPQSLRNKAVQQKFDVLLDHPLLRVLQKPNFIQHVWQFVYCFVANLNLTGIAYIVFGEDEKGQPEFYSLPTTWVKPDYANGKYKIVNPKKPESSQANIELDRSQVGFACIPNPSDPLGALAPVASQAMAIGIDEKIQTCQRVFFDNAPFPGVIVTIGKDPHPDVPAGVRPRLSVVQRKQVDLAIRKTMTGVHNYGNPAIVDGLVESIVPFSMNQREIGWDRSEDKVRQRILSVFGVHPFILGEMAASSYSQAYVIKEMFYDRINIFLEMLSIIMTTLVQNIPEYKDLTVWWELCKVEDPSMRSQMFRDGRRNNDVTENEYRAELGLPPTDNGDIKHSKSFDSPNAMSGIATWFDKLKAGVFTPDQLAKLLSVQFDMSLNDAKDLVGDGTDTQVLQQATDVLQQSIESMKVEPKQLAYEVDRILAESSR